MDLTCDEVGDGKHADHGPGKGHGGEEAQAVDEDHEGDVGDVHLAPRAVQQQLALGGAIHIAQEHLLGPPDLRLSLPARFGVHLRVWWFLNASKSGERWPVCADGKQGRICLQPLLRSPPPRVDTHLPKM